MPYILPLLFSFLVFFLYLLKLNPSFHGRSSKPKLPPGPNPLPLFGNIFQLTDKPHRALTNLSKTHGPLMFLKLGSIPTLVVSSPAMAREVLTKYDSPFSSRTIPDCVRALNHHLHSMVWLPVSPQWRYLRKISSTQLFSPQSLDSTQLLRHKNMQKLLEYVGECCRNSQAVDVGKAAFTATLNLLSNTFFSVDLAVYESGSSQEFRDLVWAMMEAGSKPNVADFFPVLGYLDPIGLRRAATSYFCRMFAVFEGIISRRLGGDSSAESDKNDVLQTLLRINRENGSGLSLDDIKHLFLDLFVAGTDTTASTLEWAMAELLRNPTMMAKAQAELDAVVGTNGSVQEPDIAKLAYLQAIVKETLRLHAPGPFLLPRKANNDVEICGYLVPKNTQVLVNIWAIGRFPDAWENPTLFDPERFLERGTCVECRGFDFIPFGAGRRMCPGWPLGNRMVHLILATLVHSFNWRVEDDIDMTEKFGITLPMAKPLLAIPLPK